MTPKDAFNFSFPFRVRFSEVDLQGIVYNSHYLTYFDTAITEYFRALPYEAGPDPDRAMAFHTVRAAVDFHAPCYADDEIEVFVRAARLGRSSIRFETALFRKGQADLLTSGEIVWVYTDQSSRKSADLPDDLRVRIDNRESNPAGEPRPAGNEGPGSSDSG